MADIGIMIEGQDGLTWERWQRLIGTAEQLGFSCVFRSDHYTNTGPPDKASLELWASLVYAAGHTQRIEFGSLVTPVTFRHPTITARVAAAADDLSRGRLVLGIGAGWQEREHHNFGIEFPDARVRLDMLEEYVQVVKLLFRSEAPVNFAGRYYQLHDAILLPRPGRTGGPPILIGGNGGRRTLPLAAKYADEWNAVLIPAERFSELLQLLHTLLEQKNRQCDAIRPSAMVGTMFARDRTSLQTKLKERGMSLHDVMQRGIIAGTPDMFVEQINAYFAAGAQRLMLQWLDQDDIEGLEIIAREVLPNLSQ